MQSAAAFASSAKATNLVKPLTRALRRSFSPRAPTAPVSMMLATDFRQAVVIWSA